MFIRRFKRITAFLMTAMLVPAMQCSAADAGDLRPLIYEENFENGISEENWYTVDEEGEVVRQRDVFYITNPEGEDILTAPVEVRDAVLTVKLAAESWNTADGAGVSLLLRAGEAGAYSMTYYPSRECVLLEYTDGEGSDSIIFDSYDICIEAGEEHTLSLSVKDCMLRGEIDGAVVLAAADFDGTALRLENGSAKVKTSFQHIKISEITLTGEDRIVYMNYDAEKTVFGEGAPRFRNSANSEIKDGRAVLTFNGSNFPGLFFSNSYMNINPGSRHTLLSFDVMQENGSLIKIVTHSNTNDYSYITYLNKNVKQSSVKSKKSWKETALSQSFTDQGSNMTLGNSPYKCRVETQTAEDGSYIELNCSIDNIPVFQARDEAQPASLCGGFSIYPEAGETKNVIYLDNVVFYDLDAETGTTDMLFSSNVEDWEKGGDVCGETTVIEGENTYALKNGKLLLKDKKLTNISVSADVDLKEKEQNECFTGIYARYSNEENYLLLCISEGKLQLREAVQGSETILKEAVCTDSKGNIELHVKDGNCRGFFNGELLIEHQMQTDNRECIGTAGIGVYGGSAFFDNFCVMGENRYFYRNQINEGASASYKPKYSTNLSHTRLNASIYFEKVESGWGTYQLSARLNGAKAYTAHIYPNSGKMTYRLMTPDWKLFVSDTDISSYIKPGEYNTIGLDTKTLENGEVRICLYVNGKSVSEKIDSESRFLPENGNDTFQVLMRFGNEKANQAEAVWLEDMSAGGEFKVRMHSDSDTITEGSSVGLTVEADNPLYEGKDMLLAAALYSEKGTLIAFELCPFTAQSGRTTKKELFIEVPAGAAGGRLKAVCVDNMEKLNVMCKSIEIK